MHVVPFHAADVILGVAWLEKLGDSVTFHYNNETIIFTDNDHLQAIIFTDNDHLTTLTGSQQHPLQAIIG